MGIRKNSLSAVRHRSVAHRALLLGSAAIALAVAGVRQPVFAQSADTAGTATNPGLEEVSERADAQQSTGSTPPHGAIALAPVADGPELEEVVVIAQKRQENIQNTPIAITALSNAVLTAEGIHDISGLTQLVPSFEVSTDQPDMQIVIRGVASSADGVSLGVLENP